MSQGNALDIGQCVSLKRTIEARDVEDFARLSLDRNPVHFDEEFAKKTIFERPVAHGLIGASLLSGALTQMMGAGNIWLDASIRFKKPVFVGDELEVQLTIKEIDRRGVATLDAVISNQSGDTVVEGELRSMNFLQRKVRKSQ